MRTLKSVAFPNRIFDPHVTEIFVRHYTHIDDHVLDPWSGGTARGVVISMMRRRYFGTDVRLQRKPFFLFFWD